MLDEGPTLHALFDAFERKDLETVLAGLDPDIVIYQEESLPYGGTYHGHDGFLNLLQRLDECWEEFDVRPLEIIGNGEHLAAQLKCVAKARSTGSTLETTMVELFSFQNGKVSEIRVFNWDTTRVLRTLGIN